MSHHGDNPEEARELREQMKKIFGEFPNGRLNQHDQGAVAVAIGHEKDVVTLTFPHTLKWIGFTADQAIEIAEMLIKHARQCGSKKPITINIG